MNGGYKSKFSRGYNHDDDKQIGAFESIESFRVDANSSLSKYFHWDIITIFYKALHLIDALFILETGHFPMDHSTRNKETLERFPDIYTHYKQIYNFSIKARYQPSSLNISCISVLNTIYLDFYKMWSSFYHEE